MVFSISNEYQIMGPVNRLQEKETAEMTSTLTVFLCHEGFHHRSLSDQAPRDAISGRAVGRYSHPVFHMGRQAREGVVDDARGRVADSRPCGPLRVSLGSEGDGVEQRHSCSCGAGSVPRESNLSGTSANNCKVHRSTRRNCGGGR